MHSIHRRRWSERHHERCQILDYFKHLVNRATDEDFKDRMSDSESQTFLFLKYQKMACLLIEDFLLAV